MMPRANLEGRGTFDDLFGPETRADPEVEAARWELSDRIDAEVHAIFPPAFFLVRQECLAQCPLFSVGAEGHGATSRGARTIWCKVLQHKHLAARREFASSIGSLLGRSQDRPEVRFKSPRTRPITHAEIKVSKLQGGHGFRDRPLLEFFCPAAMGRPT